MSYILDALRRAEAERERGAVPSLASQQHSIEIEEEAPQRSRGLVWAVIGLAFALVATLAWTLLGNRGAPPADIVQAPAATAPVAPAPVPQSLAEIAATPSAAAAPVQVPAPASPVPAAPSPAPAPARSKPALPAPVARHVAKAAPKAERRKVAAEKTAATSAAAAPAPAAAASEPRVYAVAELPENIRRELPRVAINGSSYSGDAASRMVMVNGQVFHEGDQLSNGLVLDKIRRRSAVFAYKGYRYEVTF